MIDLNNFRYIISIFNILKEKNSVGQEKEVLNHYSDFYCAKYDWSNKEQYEGKNLIESNIKVFRIYYDENINTSYVLKFEDKFYDIKGVKEIGYKDGIEITAQYKSNK
ncbi:hypothetical protein P872_18485 [Rhodonellum psychrophilum GCM71 = DSM 17998]|uniref:Phage head-tail adapter protein n=2 Tax=Rhodonellum TaxID=336827 RepID=U5BXU7_9BACT|nr:MULTISPECIES: head-tail adaptor protein [Rhodonellum]ERM82384.1 hypothetical protein P872_18485 [Rhodonellum psychrophilum GCM71 = DSM 17998]SDZ35625.1 Phage head-tail joining protein [Rhodonellum ikkaensis]